MVERGYLYKSAKVDTPQWEGTATLLIPKFLHQISTKVNIFLSFRDKKFRVFAFGDYEYLCKMYGLAGASGKILSEPYIAVPALYPSKHIQRKAAPNLSE